MWYVYYTGQCGDEGGARARARGWGGAVEEQGEEGGARARARGWGGAVEEQGEEGRGLRATLLREDSEEREGVSVCG